MDTKKVATYTEYSGSKVIARRRHPLFVATKNIKHRFLEIVKQENTSQAVDSPSFISNTVNFARIKNEAAIFSNYAPDTFKSDLGRLLKGGFNENSITEPSLVKTLKNSSNHHNEQSRNRLLTEFVFGTKEKNKAVDTDAALNAHRFYALDELRRVQKVGATLNRALARLEGVDQEKSPEW